MNPEVNQANNTVTADITSWFKSPSVFPQEDWYLIFQQLELKELLQYYQTGGHLKILIDANPVVWLYALANTMYAHREKNFRGEHKLLQFFAKKQFLNDRLALNTPEDETLTPEEQMVCRDHWMFEALKKFKKQISNRELSNFISNKLGLLKSGKFSTEFTDFLKRDSQDYVEKFSTFAAYQKRVEYSKIYDEMNSLSTEQIRIQLNAILDNNDISYSYTDNILTVYINTSIEKYYSFREQHPRSHSNWEVSTHIVSAYRLFTRKKYWSIHDFIHLLCFKPGGIPFTEAQWSEFKKNFLHNMKDEEYQQYNHASTIVNETQIADQTIVIDVTFKAFFESHFSTLFLALTNDLKQLAWMAAQNESSSEKLYTLMPKINDDIRIQIAFADEYRALMGRFSFNSLFDNDNDESLNATPIWDKEDFQYIIHVLNMQPKIFTPSEWEILQRNLIYQLRNDAFKDYFEAHLSEFICIANTPAQAAWIAQQKTPLSSDTFIALIQKMIPCATKAFGDHYRAAMGRLSYDALLDTDQPWDMEDFQFVILYPQVDAFSEAQWQKLQSDISHNMNNEAFKAFYANNIQKFIHLTKNPTQMAWLAHQDNPSNERLDALLPSISKSTDNMREFSDAYRVLMGRLSLADLLTTQKTWDLEDFKHVIKFNEGKYAFRGNVLEKLKQDIESNLKNETFKQYYDQHINDFISLTADPLDRAWIATANGIPINKLIEIIRPNDISQYKKLFNVACLNARSVNWRKDPLTEVEIDTLMGLCGIYTKQRDSFAIHGSHLDSHYIRALSSNPNARAALHRYYDESHKFSPFDKKMNSYFEWVINANSPWHESRFLYPSLLLATASGSLIILQTCFDIDYTTGYEASGLMLGMLATLSVYCYRLAPDLQNQKILPELKAHCIFWTLFILAAGLAILGSIAFADPDLSHHDVPGILAQSVALLAAPWAYFTSLKIYDHWTPRWDDAIYADSGDEFLRKLPQRLLWGALSISALLVALDVGYGADCTTGAEGYVMMAAMAGFMIKNFNNFGKELDSKYYPAERFAYRLCLVFSLALLSIAIAAACDVSFAETFFEKALNSGTGAAANPLIFSSIGIVAPVCLSGASTYAKKRWF